jgi:hypothetical protein
VTYDDETLMAYADGELDPSLRAEISAAIARDPVLARRVEAHHALRAEVGGAFAPVIDQPVPERLLAAARGSEATDRARGNVVQFPARIRSVSSSPWRAREWLAMAASLLLGVLVTWKMLSPGDASLVAMRDGTMVARGALAEALERQLASQQTGAEPVLIGLTFATPEGHYCRSFSARVAGTSGLACHASGEWLIPIIDAAPAGDTRQATAPSPPVLQAIEARIAGDPVDAAGEQRARDAGWDAVRP